MNNEVNFKLFRLFNRNIPLDNKYTNDEIKVAFEKSDHSLGTKREQYLYIRFFKECSNDEDLINLKDNYSTTTQKVKKLYMSFSTERKIEFGSFWFRRFNLPEIIGDIALRTDDKYSEIDSFETYELTPCIAYEMAIRNKDVKKLLYQYKIISEMSNDYKHYSKRYFTKHNYKERFNHPIIEFRDDYKDLNYEEYKSIIRRKHNTYSKLIQEDYKKFIDDYIYMCTELDISFLSTLLKKIEKELINEYLIYPKGYRRNVPGSSFEYEEEVLNSKKEIGTKIIDKDSDGGAWQIRFEKIIHDEFIQVQGIHVNNDKEYFVNNIIPNFSRQVNDQNQITIPINFSLPIEEIEEYIRKVKEKIEPKTPLELLGKKLEKADDLTNINTIDNKNKEVSFDMTRGEKPQEKIADLLYIYDMRERGFSNSKIIEELEKKYSNKLTAMSDNTVKKYFTIAKDYIDNERYKELITGKKIAEETK